MKNGWKWVLIICLVFIVAFFISGAVFFFIGYNRLLAASGGTSGGIGIGRMPGILSGLPRTGGEQMSWFRFGWRLLLGLGIIALIILAIWALTQGSKQHAPASTVAAPSAPAAAVQPSGPRPEAAATLRCASCSHELQPGWVVCPYCGKRIEPGPQQQA